MTRHFAFLLVLLTAFAGFAPASRAEVAMRGEVEIDRAIVKLSDVFDGLPDGVDAAIARAPEPGKSIAYDALVLDHLARQYKLDWKPQTLADHMLVKSVGSRITADMLREAVAEKIKALDIRGDIEVTFDRNAVDVGVPGTDARFELQNFDYDAVAKRFRTALVTPGYTGPNNVTLAGRVSIRQKVPVLVRRLESGSLIGSNDIDWVSIPEDRLAGLATSASELVNHELRRDQDADVPVHMRDVMLPRMVERGALVTMKVESPLMMVTAQGRSLQDGKLGDVVRVKNTQSNRMVEGTVEGPGIVVIQTGQRVAAADAREGQQNNVR